jgi:hypothetical protein
MTSAEAGGEPDTSEVDRRERSTIKFPYGDLDDALEIAGGVQHWGRSCALDQLAAKLQQTTTSGAFRTKLYSAVTFGVVKTGKGHVTLTPLGQRVVDPTTQADALVEAFLRVPLYKHIFEAFKGNLLPSDAGIEQEMIRAGVSPKVAAKARQAFQRSAQQAGFFRTGLGRLVEPPRGSVGGVTMVEQEAPPPPSPPAADVEDEAVSHLHPLLVGLIKTIPADGEKFPPKKQRQWLEAAKVNFGLIFGTDDDDDLKDLI